jgi:short-subunit dehydrogenase
MNKKVIVIGATSGIGKALAEQYASEDCIVGITGRRIELLDQLALSMPQKKIHIKEMDVADISSSRKGLAQLVQEMGGVDIIIINAGVGFPKPNLEKELQTIDINVRGFMSIAQWSYTFFSENGGGKIVGISSVAAVRSSPYAPEYHASKAFVASYLEGLRMRSIKRNEKIEVIEIRPGFVDTAMTKSNKGMFWIASPQKAAKQIIEAINRNIAVAYVTKRYWFLAQFLKVVPDWLIAKLM